MYNSILGKEVLTLNRKYFRLRKPIERRVYEIARKHCGQRAKKEAPNYDIYYLEIEWKKYWIETRMKPLTNPDGAFINFCKKRHEAKPSP